MAVNFANSSQFQQRESNMNRPKPLAVAAAILFLVVLSCLAAPALSAGASSALDTDSVWGQVEHHWAKNGDVKIHYATLGQGKPVLFVHGFPDFWYSWRHQMATLAPDYKTAALDLRGYNQSDQPEGIENYAMPKILADVAAVIDDLGVDKVTLVGHDWGGAIAWRFAMEYPDKVERLVILNLTHPRGYAAVVANPTEAQKKNTEYARNFASSKPDGSPVPAPVMSIGARQGGDAGERYKEAFGRSYWDGMLNYYRANYNLVADSNSEDLPNLKMPVLQFHGLKDSAVDKDGLSNTWDWIDADYTLVTIPSADHWVQWEARDMVSSTLLAWLQARD
jgi:pimeloyl-ACP methyl ester carboxylesterase